MMASEDEATRRERTLLVRAALVAGALALLGASALQHAQRAAAHDAQMAHRPIESSRHGYVSSKQCRSCHREQYDSWHSSYHRTMTQPATPQTVFGDFGGVEIKYDGQTARLSREGDVFYADLDNILGFGQLGVEAQGGFIKKPIVLVTGSHHMQVYWYETGQGRALGQLPFIYLKQEQRWIPRAAAFLRPPGKPRPSETGRWNAVCINCHTTHGQPRTADLQNIDSQVAEFGIACEACHGPARGHLAANASPWARYLAHFDDQDADASIINPRKLDHRRASEVCSQCHGIWQFKDAEHEVRANRDGFPLRPGSDPEQALYLYQPSRRDKDAKLSSVMAHNEEYTRGQFWSDGMARVSGREFNGMIDSPCFQRGELSCISCHSMHQESDDARPAKQWADDQLARGMEGDRACTQCHGEIAGAIERHTHHAANSEGSRCYSCHMPYTSYGLLKAIRTHQITSPDVAVTLKSGRPNACNLCHLDKSLGWTAAQLASGWGVAAPELDEDHETLAASVIDLLAGDAGKRALIASALGREAALSASGRDWVPPLLGVLMDDPYDAVRQIAHRSLGRLGGFERLDYDPIIAPSKRKPVAPAVTERARERLQDAAIPDAVPLLPDGTLDARAARLLAGRDQRPINLLE